MVSPPAYSPASLSSGYSDDINDAGHDIRDEMFAFDSTNRMNSEYQGAASVSAATDTATATAASREDAVHSETLHETPSLSGNEGHYETTSSGITGQGGSSRRDTIRPSDLGGERPNMGTESKNASESIALERPLPVRV